MHLKTKVVLVTLLLLITSHVRSAGIIQGIEIEIGPNYGFMDYDKPMEIWDPKWSWGFTGGVLLNIPLFHKTSLVPELRYSQMKNNVKLVNSIIKGEFSIEHNYVFVTLLLRYEISKKVVFMDIGPEFALMLSSKSHNDYYDPIAGYIYETEDISFDIKSYNIGACARAGFGAHRWNIPIAISVAYHHGFTGVAKKYKWWSDWKTREFTVCLSYVYEFNK